MTDDISAVERLWIETLTCEQKKNIYIVLLHLFTVYFNCI